MIFLKIFLKSSQQMWVDLGHGILKVTSAVNGIRNLFLTAMRNFNIPPPKYLIFHVFLTVKSIYFHRNKCFKRLDFRFTKKIRFDFPQNFNILFGEISIYFFGLQRNFNIPFRFTSIF